MSEAFSSTLRLEAQQMWDRIFSHPFILEVQSGELPLEKFRYYMIQDYLYLEGFGQAVSAALARAQDSETIRKLTHRLTTPIERPFQLKMLELLEIDVQEAERARRAPTNRAYVDHMLVAAQSGTVGEAAAALLPCPWTYHEIGSGLSRSPHPVYAEWIEAYATGFLEESAAAWRELVDTHAAEAGEAEREAMRRAFMVSSRYEYMFWTMAYGQEGWPL